MRRGLFVFWIVHTITSGIDDHGLTDRFWVRRSIGKTTSQIANSAGSSLKYAWILARLATHACNSRTAYTTNYDRAAGRNLEMHYTRGNNLLSSK